MARVDYRIDRLSVVGKAAFTEASREELRALIALVELGGVAESESELATAAEISPARCKAALAFWEESGVIIPVGQHTVSEEFSDRLVRGEIDERPATEVAVSIRDENLASMIDECATLMGEACLPNADVKNITALHTQYSLSADYIVTLAAYLAGKGDLTARKLCNEAIRISGKGCDSTEALEAYIKDMEDSTGAEWEFRRVLGIYGRNLSASEKKYFKKWAEDFGYSVTIVTEAFNIATLNTQKADVRYMDKILTDWHEAGCRTVNECKARSEAEKAKLTAEKAPKKQAKSEAPTPRYGNFDVNEAFMNALERSFKSEDD